MSFLRGQIKTPSLIFTSCIVLGTAFVSPAIAATVSLDETLRSALTKNETVGQSRERVFQAEERVSQTAGAALPTFSLNGVHQIQDRPNDAFARDFFPEKQTTLNLSLNQPLFRGLREFATYRQQGKLASAERRSREQSLLDLYRDVATAYLAVLSLEQDLRNLDAQSELYDQRIRELTGRVRTGQSNRTEVLTAQSAQAGLQAEMQVVRGQLKTARETFAFTTGLPSDSDLKDPNLWNPEKAAKPVPIGDYLRKVENRPDIRAARERFEASDEGVSIARGAHWPSLDAVGNYYLIRPGGLTEGIDWDLQLRLTIPLFEGGITQSKLRESVSKRTEADLELRKLRRAAEREIRSLHENLVTRADQVRALLKAVDLSEKNYQVLQRDYRLGLTRNTDVQLALNEFRVARRALDQARFAAQLEFIRLESAAAIVPEALTGEFAR